MEEKTVLEVKKQICIDCGNEFIITPAEQKFYIKKGYELPKRCNECRNHKRDSNTFTCVDCGKEFTLTRATINYYERNNLMIPKRCEECRSYKKQRNKELNNN